MNDISMDIHNKFEFKLIDAKTGEIKQEAIAYNVVLDQYFNMMMGKASKLWASNSSNTRIQYLNLGTGDLNNFSQEELNDLKRTAMVSFKASKATTLQSITLEDEGKNVAVYTAIFDVSEANTHTSSNYDDDSIMGISEVALSCGSNVGIVTWAPITNAVGAPITIKKTNADILHITATIYSYINVSSDSTMHVARKIFSGQSLQGNTQPWLGPLDYENDSEVTYGGYQPSPITYTTLGVSNIAAGNLNLMISSSTIPLLGGGTVWSVDSSCTYAISGSYFYANEQGQDGAFVVQTQQVPPSSGNISKLPLIKSISFWNGCWISFPNEEVFKPVQLELSIIGDSSTTDFNLGIPELMTGKDNVTVKIGNKTLEYGTDYIWYGRDYNYGQAWKSYDTKYIAKLPIGATATFLKSDKGAVPFAPGWLAVFGGNFYTPIDESDDNYYYWDFGEEYEVSEMFRECAEGDSGYAGYNYAFCLQYSTNNKDWKDFKRGIYENTTSNIKYTVDTPIKARYWRFAVFHETSRDVRYATPRTAHQSYSGSDYGAWWVFGHPTPQIRFVNPPDGEVTILAKCEYPIKNSNWSIDASTFTFNITRKEMT